MREDLLKRKYDHPWAARMPTVLLTTVTSGFEEALDVSVGSQ